MRFTSERDSPRDQLVVTLFLLTVFGLLLGAGIRSRILKAGLETNLPWRTGVRWWEVSRLIMIPKLSSLTMARRHGYLRLEGSLRTSTWVIGVAVGASENGKDLQEITRISWSLMLTYNMAHLYHCAWHIAHGHVRVRDQDSFNVCQVLFYIFMGSICSKRNSTHYVGGREVLGGSGTGGSDPQSAAALAAARRQKEVSGLT
jgi:hypothetical protein